VSSVASGESAAIPLPCGNWTVNAAGTLYRYRDTSSSTCKVVLIKGGRLQKAVCNGTQVGYDLGTPGGEVSVDVVVRTGSAPRRWCTTFNATTEGCAVVKNGSDDNEVSREELQ
jgi:hypothetical protein